MSSSPCALMEILSLRNCNYKIINKGPRRFDLRTSMVGWALSWHEESLGRGEGGFTEESAPKRGRGRS